jgi:DNA-binding LacI/PurR family transcriptional regulator
MHPVSRLSLVEQTALHLQRGFEAGRWQGALPGVLRLAAELGVSKDTTEAALVLLESRGCIVSRGRGRRREIVPDASAGKFRQSLRIGMLLRDGLAKSVSQTQEIFLKLTHDLESLGHKPLWAPKSLDDLGHDPERIGRMVTKCQADAWILSGAAAEVIDWFHRRGIPYILLGGRQGDYPVATASMDSSKALRETVQQLIGLGHARIVLICLPDWVRPEPGRMVRTFLQQLRDAGLPAGDYNAPWHESTPDGFAKLLESLFKLTPPTALIVPNLHYAIAVLGFLGTRGLSVPRDLSLVVRSADPAFDWMRPQIAHFQCPTDKLIRRIVQWIDRCAKGKPDRDTKVVDAMLVEGETMAPPPIV